MIKSQKFMLLMIVAILSMSYASDTAIDYSHPQAWGGICQTGSFQSPIDINTKKLNFCPNFVAKFKYFCFSNPLNPTGDAFTIQSSSTGSAYVGIKDGIGQDANIRLYQTLQFHFHAPSQHTVNGKNYPLQMHNFFVAMSSQDGTNLTLTQTFANFNTSGYTNTNSSIFAAVLGYFFYPSDDASALDLNIHTDSNGIAQVNRLQILGCTSSRLWYHYRGSATTPPCTQTVDWFVYRQPLPIKTSNYNAIKAAMNGGHPNARPVQNIGTRTVSIVGDACPTT